jgi:hypothetical protein
MSLFFDAAWFDGRLAARKLGRADLCDRLGLDAAGVEALFANQIQPSPTHIAVLAETLGADEVEIGLRAGVAARAEAEGGETSARIGRIEARLDAIDQWIEDFERLHRKSA